MSIETSQLQTLVAVARAGSFSKAAEQLGVTQSAISQSIKNLEKKIEIKLFKRSGKSVVLTPEGEKLHGLAHDFLDQMDETLEDIKESKDIMRGKVRVGTLTGIGKSWVAPELLDFSAENDGLTVHVKLGFHEDLVQEFENYKLDFLVLPEESLPNVGEKVLLSEEKLVLVYPNNDSFPIHEDMDLETLTEFPTILFEKEDTLFLKWCRSRYGKGPKKINVRYIVNSHGNMLTAVKEGLGLAVVPDHVLSRSHYRKELKTLGPKYEVSNGRFYIVYHKDSIDFVRIKSALERLTAMKNLIDHREDD